MVPTSEDEEHTEQQGFAWFGRIVTTFLVAVTVMAVATAVLVEPGAWALATLDEVLGGRPPVTALNEVRAQLGLPLLPTA